MKTVSYDAVLSVYPIIWLVMAGDGKPQLSRSKELIISDLLHVKGAWSKPHPKIDSGTYLEVGVLLRGLEHHPGENSRAPQKW